jgi:hypothetical protein
MWDCEKCGCMAIAGSLGFCPQCFTPKEEAMAKVTVEGGATNADEQNTVQTAPDGPQEPPETPPADDESPETAEKAQRRSTSRAKG